MAIVVEDHLSAKRVFDERTRKDSLVLDAKEVDSI
jgi:hypothetical protein